VRTTVSGSSLKKCPFSSAGGAGVTTTGAGERSGRWHDWRGRETGAGGGTTGATAGAGTGIGAGGGSGEPAAPFRMDYCCNNRRLTRKTQREANESAPTTLAEIIA